MTKQQTGIGTSIFIVISNVTHYREAVISVRMYAG